MKRCIFLFIFLLGINSFASQLEPEIISIKGSLFYHGKNQWSENIFDEKFHIWNATIGEGSLKGPADRTIFYVEARAAERQKINVKIDLMVKGKKQKTFKSSKVVSFLNKGETMTVPILVEDVTYGDVVVTAFVEDSFGKPMSKVKVAKVTYGGGE